MVEPLSVTGIVLEVGTVAWKLGQFCFQYAQSVKRAEKEVDALLGQIHNFHTALRRLKSMLEEEEERAGSLVGDDRLKNLRDVMAEESLSLKTCRDNLRSLQDKISKGETGRLLSRAKIVRDEEDAMRIWRNLRWPFKQDEVKRMMDNMREVAQQIDRARDNDAFSMILETNSSTKKIEVNTEKTSISMAKLEEDFHDEKEDKKRQKDEKKKQEIRTAIMSWLKPTDQNENHTNARAVLLESANTGSWFLTLENFTTFKQTDKSILWLHGDPGCGKTILSSTIIEDLKVNTVPDRHSAVVFWYFSNNDTRKMSLTECIRALSAQIIAAFPKDVPGAIEGLWADKMKGNDMPKLSDLKVTIQRLLGDHKMSLFIVLDALDECREEEYEEVFDFVQGLVSNTHPDIHIVLTSRSQFMDTVLAKSQQSGTLIGNMTMDFVEVRRECVDSDIKAHIQEQFKSGGRLKQWSQDDEARSLITETIMEKANGMFLFAQYQLEEVRKCKSKYDLRKALKKMPTTLQTYYERELGRIDDEDIERAITTLEWLAFPQRKLRVEEMNDLLAVDYLADDPYFDLEKKLNYDDEIFHFCGSLVKMDKSSEILNHKGEKTVVNTLTISHPTVQDYLRGQTFRVGTKDVKFTAATANFQMAVTCLGYLKTVFEENTVLGEEVLEKYTCARFCAEYWDDYYREVIKHKTAEGADVDMEHLNRLVLEFLDSDTSLLKLFQLCDPNYDDERVNFRRRTADLDTPLYYAALHGLPDIVQHYVNEGHDVNYISFQGYGTPLAAAAMLGRTAVIDILLVAGADPSISGKPSWGHPLALAVEFDNADIVKILIGHQKVDINCVRHQMTDSPQTGTIEGVDKGTVFDFNSYERDDMANEESMVYIAAAYNSPQALKILLDHGADPNIAGGRHNTALQAACHFGDEPMAERLLEKGARVEYGGHSGNALIAACRSPALSVGLIRKLVDIGTDVNYIPHETEGRKAIGALNSAVQLRDADTVSLLLERGANPNERGYAVFDNALQAACNTGNPDIVRLLLQYGADTTFQGAGCLDNCLNAAVTNGHCKVVQILLDAGVSPNFVGDQAMPPILKVCFFYYRSGWPYDDVTKVLLEHGADPNAVVLADKALPDFPAFTPDSLRTLGDINAIQFANLAQSKMLLEKGADVNHQSQNGLYPPPLYYAIRKEDLELVNLLLENGADPEIHIPNYGTLFSHACAVGNLAIVKRLKEVMDPDLKAPIVDDQPYGGSALLSAVNSGNSHVVTFLVDSGAPINATYWLGSALMIASQHGHQDVIEILYEAGCDLHITNIAGQNALLRALRSRKWASAEKLLRYGLEMNFRDKKGCNGLHYAACAGSIEFIEKAVGNGIDPDCIDSYGWTALHWAAASFGPTTGAIKSLLKTGANRTLRDEEGRTPLDLALMFRKPTEATILRSEEPLPENIPVYDFGEATRQKYAWESEQNCHGCGDNRGTQYCCKAATCRIFLCFRCIHDNPMIHFPTHEFEVTIEYKPPVRHSSKSTRVEENTTLTSLICEETQQSHYLTLVDGVYTAGLRKKIDGDDVTYAIGNTWFSSSTPYFEVTVVNLKNTSNKCALGIGLAIEDAERTGMVGWEEGSWGYHSDDGCFFHGDPTKINYASGFEAGDTVGCGIDPYLQRFDPETRAIFFTKNGENLGSIIIDLDEPVFPVVTVQGRSARFSVDFGEDEFLWKQSL